MDDEEIGLVQNLRNLDNSQPHRIRLKPKITMEASKHIAHLSSQYLCGTAKPDSQHIICEEQVQNNRGYWKTVKLEALIDCGATHAQRADITCIYYTARRRRKVIMEARDLLQLNLGIQYFDYLKPITERDCLVVNMQAYDLVLSLPWFQRDPEN